MKKYLKEDERIERDARKLAEMKFRHYTHVPQLEVTEEFRRAVGDWLIEKNIEPSGFWFPFFRERRPIPIAGMTNVFLTQLAKHIGFHGEKYRRDELV